MALYTNLNKKQITGLARHFNLGPPKKLKGILEGTVNTYYQLTYPKKTYFLKIDEVGDLRRLIKELKILNLLSKFQKRLKYHTPVPLKTNRGGNYIPFRNKFVLVFEKLKGKSRSINSLKSGDLNKIGRALANMHRIRAKLAPHRFNLPELFRVYKQIEKKLKRKHPLIDLEVRQWLQWLKKEEPKGIPSGLIHADLFPENILFNGDRVAGILDFEAAGSGPYLFDIATTLHACCHGGRSFSVQKAKNFLRGYKSIRKLTKKEKTFFEYFLFQSSVRFLLTRLRDFELKEGKVKAKPFKDYREFLRRFSEIPGFAEKLM